MNGASTEWKVLAALVSVALVALALRKSRYQRLFFGATMTLFCLGPTVTSWPPDNWHFLIRGACLTGCVLMLLSEVLRIWPPKGGRSP